MDSERIAKVSIKIFDRALWSIRRSCQIVSFCVFGLHSFQEKLVNSPTSKSLDYKFNPSKSNRKLRDNLQVFSVVDVRRVPRHWTSRRADRNSDSLRANKVFELSARKFAPKMIQVFIRNKIQNSTHNWNEFCKFRLARLSYYARLLQTYKSRRVSEGRIGFGLREAFQQHQKMCYIQISLERNGGKLCKPKIAV